MMLAIGNFLNGGTPRGGAYGFKVDVLKKFSELKVRARDTQTVPSYELIVPSLFVVVGTLLPFAFHDLSFSSQYYLFAIISQGSIIPRTRDVSRFHCL